MNMTRKKGFVREYGEALLTALLIAFFIRSFVIEAFKIPSGSMIPTLMVGDHIFVNKFVYGLRIPFTKTKIVTFGTPKRGEPIVFMYPMDESKDFIKRVVGLPGDVVRVHGEEVIINGQPVTHDPIADISSIPAFGGWQHFKYYSEDLGGTHHLVQFDDDRTGRENEEFTITPDHLFVMGDNRDNSSDSRDWGLVPLENIKGRAMFVWLSIDFDRKTLRWDRFGKWIR